MIYENAEDDRKRKKEPNFWEAGKKVFFIRPQLKLLQQQEMRRPIKQTSDNSDSHLIPLTGFAADDARIAGYLRGTHPKWRHL